MGDGLRQRTQFLGINRVGSMNNHTRLSLENCLRQATLRKRLPYKNCVSWTTFATLFLLQTVCATFNNANDLTGKIVCDVPVNGNVFLGATVWDVHTNGNV